MKCSTASASCISNSARTSLPRTPSPPRGFAALPDALDRFPTRTLLFELKQLVRKATAAESIECLRGKEGAAAHVYFRAFSGMLKADDLLAFDFERAIGAHRAHSTSCRSSGR